MFPRVSFLLPVYNEQQHLGEALESIAAQDYPHQQIEVLVAEGNSTDATRALLAAFRERRPDIALRIIENPSRNTSVGRNLCLKNATGEMVMNFSGHAVAQPRMLSVLVEKLSQSSGDVAGAGCAIETASADSMMGRAVATVLRSPLGGGGRMDSSYHAAEDCFARSLAFCLYRRELVEQVGGFDPDFWCGQDAELNLRLSRAGHRLLFTPATSVRHYKRSSLGQFASQMVRYGLARAMIVRKFPTSLRPALLLPAVWVIALLAAAVLSPLWHVACLAALAAGLLFVVASFGAAVAAGGGLSSVLLSPVVLAVLYTSYGLGFLLGLLPMRLTSTFALFKVLKTGLRQ